jgi:glycosyltransferase involved in cell wall biosynthesis
MGRFDLVNVYLAIKHLVQFAALMHVWRPRLVYIPISQGTAGYLRDGLFILMARLSGAKIVLHLRGSGFRTFYAGGPRPMKAFIRSTLSLSSRLLLLCRSVAKSFRGLYPLERIRIVPNGLALPDLPRRPPNGDGRRVTYVSRLGPEKGFLDLLEAAPSVLERFPETEFVFAGDGPPSQVRRRVERSMSVWPEYFRSRIRFLPPVSGGAKAELLSRSDVFVFPPRHAEGQPWAILEAMSAGLPVVATDRGCIQEMVVDRETGFIVHGMCPSEIGQRLLLLLGDDALRRRMGERARARVESIFNEKAFIDALEQAWLDVAG